MAAALAAQETAGGAGAPKGGCGGLKLKGFTIRGPAYTTAFHGLISSH